MSLIVKFFAFLLVLGLAGMFVLKDPNGQPFLSLEDFIPDTSSISNSVSSAVEQVLPEQIIGETNKTMVYRWKDANGNWQFSDTPPANITAEQIALDTHLNSDIAPPAPTPQAVAKSSESGRAIFISDGNKPSAGIGTTVSPDNIKQLIQDANNVQGLMDERAQQINAIK